MNNYNKNNYQEDISLELFEHKSKWFNTETVGVTSSDTDIISYTVPLGRKLLLKNIDFSKAADEAIVVSITVDDVIVFNWTTLTAGHFVLNDFMVDGGKVLKVVGKGITVGDMSVNISGNLIQLNSVPVDLTSYNVTGGNEEITVSWNEQTPGETSDLKYFEVRLYKDGGLIQTEILEDKDATGLTFTGLTNDVEYTVEANWVGYDNKKGTTATGSATPAMLNAYTLGSGFDPTNNPTDGVYFRTTDNGASWSSETTLDTGYSIQNVAVNDNFSLVTVIDPDEVLDAKLKYSTDGVNWVEYDSYIPHNAIKIDDLLYRTSSVETSASLDNITWNTVTGITEMGGTGCKMDGNYYMNDNDTSIDKSADGYTFAPMTNQPSIFNVITSSATRLLVMDANEERTTMEYEYADGDVAWTSGGASTITATELSDINVCYYGGLFHVVTFENDFSVGYYETSPDGVTWTDVSSNLPVGNLPVGIGTDGINLYIALANNSTFEGSVMTYDGSSYATPVALNAGSIIPLRISGKN